MGIHCEARPATGLVHVKRIRPSPKVLLLTLCIAGVPSAASAHTADGLEGAGTDVRRLEVREIDGRSVEIFTHKDPIPAAVPGTDASGGTGDQAAGEQVSGLPNEWCGEEIEKDNRANETTPRELPKFKAVYAYSSEQENRFTLFKHIIQSQVRAMAERFAAETQNARSVRWDLGTKCGPGYADIAVVASEHADPDFFELRNEVRAKLLPTGVHPRNYVIFFDDPDTPFYGGQAMVAADDRPDSGNAHNSGDYDSIIWSSSAPLTSAPNDRDADTVDNHLDWCGWQPADTHPNPIERDLLRGCPPQSLDCAASTSRWCDDDDSDGARNWEDVCPTEAGPDRLAPGDGLDTMVSWQLGTADYCPDAPDRDGDSVGDSIGNSLTELASAGPPPDRCLYIPANTANGCPADDRDSDGVHDRDDLCPDHYGEMETGCQDSQPAEPNMAHIVLHEMTHSLGGVQGSAPHATSGYHCTDGWDVMCYADGSAGSENYVTTVCADQPRPRSPYDCGRDDYFNPAPPEGSYLATHWNTHSSVFLCALSECFAGEPDLDPPETQIDVRPHTLTTDRHPSFSFSSEDEFPTFECKLDDAAYEVCESPKTYSDLPDGEHRFAVRTRDPAGNVDPTPATHDFTIDTRAPQTTVTSASGREGEGSTFTFSADEPVARFDCRIDAGEWAGCLSPLWHAVDEGAHTFEVKATDFAGNVELTPASRWFRVMPAKRQPTSDRRPPASEQDRTPPVAEIIGHPGQRVRTTHRSVRLSFEFAAADPAARFFCRLNHRHWSRCSSPRSYTFKARRRAKRHVFRVKAIDGVGNRQATAAKWVFKLKRTGRRPRG